MVVEGASSSSSGPAVRTLPPKSILEPVSEKKATEHFFANKAITTIIAESGGNKEGLMKELDKRGIEYSGKDTSKTMAALLKKHDFDSKKTQKQTAEEELKGKISGVGKSKALK